MDLSSGPAPHECLGVLRFIAIAAAEPSGLLGEAAAKAMKLGEFPIWEDDEARRFPFPFPALCVEKRHLGDGSCCRSVQAVSGAVLTDAPFGNELCEGVSDGGGSHPASCSQRSPSHRFGRRVEHLDDSLEGRGIGGRLLGGRLEDSQGEVF
jgi:hypothetical protein